MCSAKTKCIDFSKQDLYNKRKICRFLLNNKAELVPAKNLNHNYEVTVRVKFPQKTDKLSEVEPEVRNHILAMHELLKSYDEQEPEDSVDVSSVDLENMDSDSNLFSHTSVASEEVVDEDLQKKFSLTNILRKKSHTKISKDAKDKHEVPKKAAQKNLATVKINSEKQQPDQERPKEKRLPNTERSTTNSIDSRFDQKRAEYKLNKQVNQQEIFIHDESSEIELDSANEIIVEKSERFEIPEKESSEVGEAEIMMTKSLSQDNGEEKSQSYKKNMMRQTAKNIQDIERLLNDPNGGFQAKLGKAKSNFNHTTTSEPGLVFKDSVVAKKQQNKGKDGNLTKNLYKSKILLFN